MKRIVLAAVLGGAMNAQAVTSPSSTVFKVFEMRASKNSDCSNSVTIFKSAIPTPVDLFSTPTFGSGAIQDGTYHCLMFHVSDMVTVTPQDNDPLGCVVGTNCGCVMGTPYSNLDFFTSADISLTPPPGTLIQGHTGVEDDPWLYFSDASFSQSVNNCFQPTADCSCGAAPCPLPAQMVSSDQTRTLVANFDNQLDGSSGTTCVLIPAVIGVTPVPAFSIR